MVDLRAMTDVETIELLDVARGCDRELLIRAPSTRALKT